MSVYDLFAGFVWDRSLRGNRCVHGKAADCLANKFLESNFKTRQAAQQMVIFIAINF